MKIRFPMLLKEPHNKLLSATRYISMLSALLLLLALPAKAQDEDYQCTPDYDTLTTTINEYDGPGGDVTIPSVIDGLTVTRIGTNAFIVRTDLTSITIPDSVTSIGDWAFYYCASLTNVTISTNMTNIEAYAFYYCTSLPSVSIPSSVASIGGSAFASCSSLSAIEVDESNSFYSSVDGVLFNKDKTTLIQYPAAKTESNYTIPNGVATIEDSAFYSCTGLTNVTIPKSVTSIAGWAFASCNNLAQIHFLGDAPLLGDSVFDSDTITAVYYLPGTMGWEPFFEGFPTVLWNVWDVQVQTNDANFGVQNNQFGFTITGTSGLAFVVEACTDLANPAWSPVQTNTLTDSSFYFSDPEWTNYPSRFYRLRAP